MSTYPHLEARTSALERRGMNLETYVEETTHNLDRRINQSYDDLTAQIKMVHEDTIASFKQVGDYIHANEDHLIEIESHLN